jgi:hypothetical protein
LDGEPEDSRAIEKSAVVYATKMYGKNSYDTLRNKEPTAYPAELAKRARANRLDFVCPRVNRMVALRFSKPHQRIKTYNMSAGTPPSELISVRELCVVCH